MGNKKPSIHNFDERNRNKCAYSLSHYACD